METGSSAAKIAGRVGEQRRDGENEGLAFMIVGSRGDVRERDSPDGRGPFQDPEHGNAADRIGRDERRPVRQTQAAEQRDDTERRRDKRQLAGLDAEVEAEQGERNIVCGKPTWLRAPANPKPCSKPNAPATSRGALRQPRLAAPRLGSRRQRTRCSAQ